MPGTLFVGLDVGTTTSKAVVFTEDGDPVASGRATTPWTVTDSGAELDATALLDAAKSAIAQALADCPPGPVGGLGVASLAESGVLLDRRGESVAPIIAWHDTRDNAELESLREAVGAQNFSATTGLPMRQQWSLTKHRWLTTTSPRHVARCAASTSRSGSFADSAARRQENNHSRRGPGGCDWLTDRGGRTRWRGRGRASP